MKYIKKYESKKVDNVISIDLFDFCKYIGGMLNAITEINKLKSNSTGVGFTTFNNPYEHYYSYTDDLIIYDTIKQTDFDIDEDDSIAIRIGDYSFSYGELSAYNEHNIKDVKIFFYNPKIIDEKISLYINAKKYNI